MKLEKGVDFEESCEGTCPDSADASLLDSPVAGALDRDEAVEDDGDALNAPNAAASALLGLPKANTGRSIAEM